MSLTEPGHVIPSIAWLVERLAARHQVTVLALYQEPVRSEYAWRGAMVHTLAARHTGEYAPRASRFSPPGLDLVRSLLMARGIVKRAGGADVIHGLWGTASGLLTVLLGRLVRAPSLVSLYGGELVGLRDVDAGAGDVGGGMPFGARAFAYGAQLDPRARRQVALTLKLAGRLTAPTEFMRALAAEHGAEVEVVPLGVNVGAMGIVSGDHAGELAPPERRPSQTPAEGPPWRLLYVGNLNRVKDPFTLLEAVARLRAEGVDVRLDLAGADYLDGAAQRFAANQGLQAYARFLGFVDHRDLAAHYLRSHLLVIPSRHEAGPVVALEAAALGVPIVGSEVGHLADWAPGAATAVPPGDAAALAAAIAALIGDRERRTATAQAARRWAMAHDAAWSSAEFERIYRELIDR